MKACFFLLRYMITWSRPLFWLVCLGLVLLCAVIVTGVLGFRDVAFGMAIYSFIPLLVIPYLFVWRPFRIMLSCRRLALLPGFRWQLGSALLVYTVLLSVFLPVAELLFWPTAEIGGIRFVALIFLGASLFTFLMQWAVASPQAVMIFSLGPFLIFFVVSKIGPLVLLALYREETAWLLLFASALAWVLALRRTVSQRVFLPPSKAPLHARDYVWEGRADWLGVLCLNYRGAVKSAQGTLLLGYPDGGQFFQLLLLTLISPLVGMLCLYLTNMAPPQGGIGTMPDFFLGFSLFSSLIGGFGNGERAARCRLVWLREGGDRPDHWRRIERRIYSDLVLLALIVLPITGVALMFPDMSFDPLTYCVMALTGNILANYFSLAARLSQWSMFLQILMALATGAGLVLSRVLDVLPLPALVLVVLALAALFRVQAKQRFVTVDWHQLRPAGLGYKGKLA